MWKILSSLLGAILVSAATLFIHPTTDERAMYGWEGPSGEYWLPRKVAGWPAPFMADNPNTSVLHDIGIEDDFRPGPFAGTVSFWFLIIDATRRSMTRVIRHLARHRP